MNIIVIIDYGSGNIQSVYNAIKKVSRSSKTKILVSSSVDDVKKATHIILPGVGSFESCFNGLNKTSLVSVLKEVVFEKEVPFLGICVGMQMLATRSFEKGIFNGLDWIKGEVQKIDVENTKLKIPHMGWNTIKFNKKTRFIKKLLEKIEHNKDKEISAYFVHSYNFKIIDESKKVLTSNYGKEITAMVAQKNIIGTQFHPEKSHNFGLAFLETFLELKDFR
jgi:glutamine amidotransferase